MSEIKNRKEWIEKRVRYLEIYRARANMMEILKIDTEIKTLMEEYHHLPVDIVTELSKTLYSKIVIEDTQGTIHLEQRIGKEWTVDFPKYEGVLDKKVELDSEGKLPKTVYYSKLEKDANPPIVLQHRIDLDINPEIIKQVMIPNKPQKPIVFANPIHWICVFCNQDNIGLDNEEPELRMCKWCNKRQDEPLPETSEKKQSFIDKLRKKKQ